MTFSLTQSLPTKLRERLEEEATRRGQEPDNLLLTLVQEGLAVPATEPKQTQAAAEELAERFRRWADSQPRRGVPVIPLEALDREHIYGDHA